MNVTQVPQWHLEMCWDDPRLNEWWHETWLEGTVLCGNIQPGDLFSHGTADQISVVSGRIVNVGQGKEFPYFSYTIGHRIGGRYTSPKHDRMVNGHFRFIPSAVQLTLLGYVGWAQELLAEVRIECDHPQGKGRCPKCWSIVA